MLLLSSVGPGTICTQKEPFSSHSLRFCITRGWISIVSSNSTVTFRCTSSPGCKKLFYWKLIKLYATLVWQLTITTRFVDGETEAQKESTVFSTWEILQPHQASGKSLTAPSHNPMCAHTAPQGALHPTSALGSPEPGSSAAQLLTETK